VKIGIDVAASEFYDEKEAEKKYNLGWKDPEHKAGKVSGDELLEVYKGYLRDYPAIISIEDGFDQDDWVSWTKATTEIGERAQIVGDDLLVTNPLRIGMAIEKKACNALLLKLNQIGSVTESIDAVKIAKASGWAVMTSHRSGETEDTFIADLAVGLSTGQIKTGAPCRSERLAKYNQLLRIEAELGERARYTGAKYRFPAPAY